MDLLAKFMEAEKDGGWIMKHSAKAESDVFKHFRKQRNHLKSQVNFWIAFNKIKLLMLDPSEGF
jgi:hypothetical protein